MDRIRPVATSWPPVATLLFTALLATVFWGCAHQSPKEPKTAKQPRPEKPWLRTFNTEMGRGVRGIAVSETGAVYAVGQTSRSLGDDPVKGPRDAFIVKYSRRGDWEWARTFGAEFNDIAADVAVDENGDIYLVGTYMSPDADAEPLADPEHDGVIVKYSPRGKVIWNKLIGSDAQDGLNAVTTDGQGHLFIAGMTKASLDGDRNGRLEDAILSKLTLEGNTVWSRLISGKQADTAHSVTLGKNNARIFVAGSTFSNLHGRQASGRADGFVTAYTQQGERRWTRLIGGSGRDVARVTTAHGNNNERQIAGALYVAGRSFGGLKQTPPLGEKKLGDGFVAKFGTDGERRWARLVGTERADYLNGMATSPAGDVLVAGGTIGGFGSAKHEGVADGIIARIHPDGTLVSTRQFGSAELDQVFALKVTPAGQPLVGGTLGLLQCPTPDAEPLKNDVSFLQLFAPGSP